MAEKKGLLATLFGGQTGGCCDMEITEEPKKKKGGCCDMQIIEETDDKSAADDR